MDQNFSKLKNPKKQDYYSNLVCLWEQVRNYLPIILAPSFSTSWERKENQEYEEIIFHIFL